MGDQAFWSRLTTLPFLPCPPAALLGILYEDKERQDFIFTIYHWWQAVAIFTVYLGSSLPMKVSLGMVGGGSLQASPQATEPFCAPTIASQPQRALLPKGRVKPTERLQTQDPLSASPLMVLSLPVSEGVHGFLSPCAFIPDTCGESDALLTRCQL